MVHMPQEKSSVFLFELLKLALLAILIVLPVRLFVAQPFLVSGASMNPTFADGQYLIVDQLTYHFQEPKRNDVIIMRYPKKPSEFFIKRIVGLPDETIRIQNGVISVQKDAGEWQVLEQPFVKNEGNGSDMLVALGKDEYFVMGDNRPESSDSRSWGTLPRSDVIGRAFFRLLPLSELTFFPGAYTAE